ncbi:hypothetical protein Leryth_013815 [Lithospermum erythrorhizon]|nr:hypothetical protein Leryth_013815 [Lithospermum erythrorhizon]
MASSSKSNGIRSISLPNGSHPTTLDIETELKKLKSWESTLASSPTVEAICNGLCGLVETYKLMNELLNLPQTIQTISKHKEEKWVDGILEVPVKLLDICGTTRELVSEVKEIVGDLKSCLKRREVDLSIETNIIKYKSFRKNMKKISKKLIASLKQMEQEIEGVMLNVNQHVSSVVRVVREVNAMSSFVFQSLLIYLSSYKAKRSKWSVLKLMKKGSVACEGQENNQNELENLENLLSINSINIQDVKIRLEKLDVSFDCMEKGLEGMFRCFIKSRTSLLNIVSC